MLKFMKLEKKKNAKHAKIIQNCKINVKPIMKDIIYQKTIIRLFVNYKILKDVLYILIPKIIKFAQNMKIDNKWEEKNEQICKIGEK